MRARGVSGREKEKGRGGLRAGQTAAARARDRGRRRDGLGPVARVSHFFSDSFLF